ncbi:MAG: glycosyltransferase family 2 protein, partial [Desulfobacterales bacterium]
EIELLQNSENLGGAGGFNAGMRRALHNRPEAKYLWLLDNDVLADKNALKALVFVMEKNPNAAICGSRIMDIANPNELIELGAFIDYRMGDVARHIPHPEALKDPNAVFAVDYVAACSLLARASAVRKMGLWHEKFFIYWDDMEWGARFKAAGYEVLAANASAVLHPSWIGRTSDHSAVWRCYYRTRNSLWFFSNYCTGTKRRFLLCRMILRFMKTALAFHLRANSALGNAFAGGIRDFFKNSFGRKNFPPPVFPENINPEGIMFFPDPAAAGKMSSHLLNIKTKFHNAQIWAVVPCAEKTQWTALCGKDRVFAYTQMQNGRVPWGEKIKIMNFLKNSSWDLLISSGFAPKMGTVWGKYAAGTDPETGQMISFGKTEWKKSLRLPFAACAFILRAFLLPPPKDISK